MADDRVVAVAGATATGKTALAEALAERLGGEVVCADSRQVYRELEIGTGKPTLAERAARPHHLFDALGLGARASAGWYGRAVAETCAGVHARGRVPILVGGSGLYLEAARGGLAAVPDIDPGVRARVRERARREGVEAQHRRLGEVDPTTARRLAPTDRQRVLRALEVQESTGRPLSAWHQTAPASGVAGAWRTIELTVPAAALAARIAARTHAMFHAGLIEETEALVGRGLEPPLRALRAVGYEEALDLIAGTIDRAEAEARTNLRTRQLAKRQRTWFRNRFAGVRIAADTESLDALVLAALAAVDRGAADTRPD